MTNNGRLRVLFIDAYDSFSNNIISLLETSLNVEVSRVRIDAPIGDLAKYLEAYAAVVAGPGPGDPRIDRDVGLFRRLWRLEDVDTIPVLGICLGFQSLVLAYGGKISRLPEPRHGIVRQISSTEENIFQKIPILKAVQYHSLYATLGRQISIDEDEQGDYLLLNTPLDVPLSPLAWDHQVDNEDEQGEGFGRRNPKSILMAVKHKVKPLYGIQFHPESICSSLEARQLIRNWWDEITVWRAGAGKSQGPSSNGLSTHSRIKLEQEQTTTLSKVDVHIPREEEQCPHVISNSVSSANLSLPEICEKMSIADSQSIIFDSENHKTSETGAFSIIGIIDDTSVRLEYRVGSPEVLQICLGKVSRINLEEFDNNVFKFLESYINKRKAKNGNPSIPFWGGFMGYISYESCLETLGIRDSTESPPPKSRPDLGFVFIERSVVIDHMNSEVHIQSIKPADRAWVDATTLLLSTSSPPIRNLSMRKPLHAEISLPSEKQYKCRIRACQEAIRAGNSYELCLTSQTNVTISDRLPSWPMYCRLRNVNPAPFGAYIRLGNLTFLSSSPERFMRWSRPTERHQSSDVSSDPLCETASVLQFRPIKGTIARRPTPNSAPRSLFEATRLLSTQKEQAENLMIVDLIRHDLHGIVGSGRVSVPKLLVVEEYETVFQLVSVIEGTMLVKNPRKSDEVVSNGSSRTIGNGFQRSNPDECGQTDSPLPSENGIRSKDGVPSTSREKPTSPLAALPATLPPGSMTGAPKLRSCQILRSLETGPRGIYSGIVGYIDVGGGGDWSVAIRCAVRWDDPGPTRGDHWTVGAGGAVTALSTEQGEWEEMLTKLQATLRIFQD